MSEKTWQEAVELAEHYLAIGQEEIYLSHQEGPWEYVTSCEPGGSHRLEIATSVWFRAQHPCGLSFRWTFDIEPHAANGSGSYHIDTDGVLRVMTLLPEEPRHAFRNYLASCADAVEAKGREWDAIARRQIEDGTKLRYLSKGGDS